MFFSKPAPVPESPMSPGTLKAIDEFIDTVRVATNSVNRKLMGEGVEPEHACDLILMSLIAATIRIAKQAGKYESALHEGVATMWVM